MGALPDAPERLERYEQPELGYRERFSTPTLSGGTTVAVHTEPVDRLAPMTWVVLESFGPEHDNLAAFDASLCRSLASSGHATLRFHSQGQGDSERGPEALGIEDQVTGALDAVELARGETESGIVGLLGVRFGGALAALAAARTEVHSLALVDPVMKGRAFLRSLVRLDLTTDVSLGEDGAIPTQDPFLLARSTGVLEIEGLAVPWPAVVELEALDLLKMTVPSNAPTLVLQISRSDEARDDLRRLVETLGRGAALEILVNEDALRFGLPPWRPAGSGLKVDMLASLAGAVVQTVVRWCTGDGAPA